MQLTQAAHGALCASWRVLVALTLAAAPAAAAPGLVEVAWHGVPGELEAGVRRTVPVELANHGDVVWDPAAGFALSYHWLDDTGAVIVWDGARTQLPAPVAPGERVRLDAVLDAPLREGPLHLQWDVVQEGVRWLSQADPSPTWWPGACRISLGCTPRASRFFISTLPWPGCKRSARTIP